MEVAPPRVTFEGTDGTDMDEVLFTYNYVVARKKSEDDKRSHYSYTWKEVRDLLTASN